MRCFKPVAIAVALMASATLAQAADFTFSGHIAYHNDVVQVGFTLVQDAVDVKVWTDGYLDGINFDPITAVWSMPTGTLIDENDDNPLIGPGQTKFDSGLVFPTLAAGNYLFTIATYNNAAAGATLAQGFIYDGETPIAIADWCQPASDNCTNQKGTFWQVHLTGVDVATSVPEPETFGLLGLGLALVGWRVRRRTA